MESGSLHVIKSTIKALVISSPNNISIEQLNRDYKDNVGENIPFHKMGYKSLEDFLNSMPETVQICRMRSVTIVKNVSNDKTSHIEQFVRDQKKNNRSGRNNQRNIQKHAKHTPMVYSQQSYKNLGNSYIPNTYYTNLDLYSIAQANTMGIQQYDGGARNRNSYNRQQTNCNRQFASQIPQQRQQVHRQRFKSNNIAKGSQQGKEIRFQEKENSRRNQQSQSKTNNLCKEGKSQTLVPSASASTLPLPQKTERKHCESIIKSQNNEPSHQESIIKAEITEQKHQESIIGSIKNFFFKTTKPQTKHAAKENDGKSQGKHSNKRTKSPPQPSPSSCQLQQAQEESICQTDASAKCEQINDKENAVNQINLSLKNLTLKSTLTKDMNESLPSVVEVLNTHPTDQSSLKDEKQLKRSNDNNKHALKDSQHENILNNASEYDDAVPSFALKSNVFQIDYPEDVVPFGMNFTLRDLPIVDSIIALYITKIMSPEKFYYHIGNGIEDFEYLSSDIQCFYETLNDKEYRIPSHCVREGQICAASINYTWQRAIIISSLNLKRDYVKVYLVDSGYEVVLRQNEIKFLLRYFADLPIRVQIGRLTNLKPKHNGKWSSLAVQRFQNLTFDRILYGQVISVDKQENRSNIVLSDTNGRIQRNINMILIKEGHAVKIMS